MLPENPLHLRINWMPLPPRRSLRNSRPGGRKPRTLYLGHRDTIDNNDQNIVKIVVNIKKNIIYTSMYVCIYMHAYPSNN